MAAPEDPIALLSRALGQTDAIIARVKPEQATLPTPCPSWDVRALVNHVVDEVHQFAKVTGGGRRQNTDDDVIGADWVGAYRAVAAQLLAAWRQPGALEQTVVLSVGEFPATWTVGQQITELVTHAWDIAKATGQSTDLDPELGERALVWGRENLKPEHRGDEAAGYQIGPEVQVRGDAALYDRVAAFGGRNPN